ncbi:MAG: fibronectin type III domain-containing protein [Pseudomonadales bacterium]
MFQTQGHGTFNRKHSWRRFTQRLRTGVLTGASILLLAGCGGSGGNTATAIDDGVTDDPDVVQIGNGIGEAFVLGEIGIAQATLQSGGSTQLQISFVNAAGAAVTESIRVTISSNCIANSQSSIEGELETTSGGLTLDYNSNGCTGDDLITATATTPGGTAIQATGTVTIEEDAVLSVQFIAGDEPAQLSLRGVGGVESVQLKFRLVGQQSAPIVGESITFSLSTEAGGIALAETTAESNNMGEVTAIVQSGTVHTTVVVTATHDATGISGNSEGINISTGIAQANRLSMSVEYRNPRGFNFDGTEVGVGIIAADQFGNPVPDNTVISFASPEGGTIPSSCSTVNGRCSVTWVSSDPRPLGGPGDRAGRATIIAYTSGVEEFGDVNGNSIFDDGDVFDASMDLDEPFVDENENGMYDAGEFFFDFNSNGVIDIADGVWNGPLCEHSSLCAPTTDEVGIYRTQLIVMSTDGVALDVIPPADQNPALSYFDQPINIEAGQTETIYGLILQDLNGNAVPIDTTYSFETTIGTLVGTTEFKIGSRTEPKLVSGVTISAPSDPTTGTLSMLIEVPGFEVVQASWPINVQCSAPSDAVIAAGSITSDSAVASWTSNGNASSWSVEFGPAGFIEGTGSSSTTSNPHVIDGLTASTDYEYYVRSFCGAALSDSAGPVSFTTDP